MAKNPVIISGDKDPKAIENNNPEDVLFEDPFKDVTRKVRRNLLLASFIGIILVKFHLQINSFLFVTLSKDAIANEVAINGGISIILIYLLITFILYALIDFSAWNFRKEIQDITPFTRLIARLANTQITAVGQIQDATDKIQSKVAVTEVRQELVDAGHKLTQINANIERFYVEHKDELVMWKAKVTRMKELRLRIVLRFVTLLVIDIALPIILAVWYFCIAGSYIGKFLYAVAG